MKPNVHRSTRAHRSDDGRAFLPDPSDGARAMSDDDLAESLARSFLCSATSGEEDAETTRDEVFPEESGGLVVRDLEDDESSFAWS